MKKNVLLVIALGVGILAALVTRLYVSAKEAEVQSLKDSINRRYGTIEVLCFVKDTPGGTALTKGDLGLRTVPELGMRGQALTMESLSDVVGRKTLIGHRKGEIVFWSDVEGGNPRATGLSADVKRQMRAISINVSGAAAVSGMVAPNDHVDVIGTFTFPQADGKTRNGDIVTSTILQNVLVLAVGRTTAKAASPLGTGSGYSTVTLEVTPREAEMLAFAEQMRGRLVLTLRNRNDTSYEKELPQVDFEKIKSEMTELNLRRQQKIGGR